MNNSGLKIRKGDEFMDLNNFTQKSIQASQNLSSEYENFQVDEIHIHCNLI